jgi:class 3 adenylate cyclase
MIGSFDDVLEFAQFQFALASQASEAIAFSVTESREFGKKALASRRPLLIANEPKYSALKTTTGVSAWAVVLSVDMRKSSERAVRIGAKNTYLTMHTFLATLAHVALLAEGQIFGLRGDGFFAGFGITELTGSGKEVTSAVSNKAIKDATSCGKGMLEAVEEIINPVLEVNDIEAGLRIGVGIAVGDLIITRMGLGDATEVSPIGPPANQACKLSCKSSNILLTEGARRLYPSSKGGKLGFLRSEHGYTPQYPSDMKMLDRQPSTQRRIMQSA